LNFGDLLKAWIVHDSLHGNGKLLAETMGKVFEEKMEVKISHIKDVNPVKVAVDAPTILIVGTAVRAFMLSRSPKSWVKQLRSELKKNPQDIAYGAVFVTHGLEKIRHEKKGTRFLNLLKSVPTIQKFHPEWLSGKVKAIEGPLEPGTVERFEEEARNILNAIMS